MVSVVERSLVTSLRQTSFSDLIFLTSRVSRRVAKRARRRVMAVIFDCGLNHGVAERKSGDEDREQDFG